MGYLEGTNEARTELFAGEAKPDVSGREPHKLSGVKESWRSVVSVGKAFLGIRGFLQMPVSGLAYPLTTPKPVIDSWDSTRLHLALGNMGGLITKDTLKWSKEEG